MKKIILFLAALFALFATAAELPDVTGLIDGRRLAFNPDIQAQIVQRSLDLLASCTYMNATPNWGAPAEPQDITEALKQSHLHITFPHGRKVEVPTQKTTLQAREIVITLPIASAGIWVRTDNGVIYFAKFQHAAAEKLRKSLPKAAKP